MPTTKKTRQLLLEIARCPIVESCIDGSEDHPCRSIVSEQPPNLRERHVPEPWNGLIDAPILFLSSNPSIDPEELFPVSGWPDDKVVDFFENRFDGEGKWTAGHLYPLLKNRRPRPTYVKFWAEVRGRATELLGPSAIPGVDYSMSEIVHCKSTREQGVNEALDECATRYLKKLVSVSGARLTVVLGAKAESKVRQVFQLDAGSSIEGPVRIGRRERRFAFLPHPNAHMKRKFKDLYSAIEIEHLRSLVS